MNGFKWVASLLLSVGLAGVTATAQAQTVVKYVHTDALGSVVAITDASRNVIERREYEPYGQQLTPTVQDGPGYTGHVQDAATGLTYMQQRYYDPQVGLFLSVDPVTAYSNPMGQFHRYRYANNNPYRFTDPDGRQSRDNVQPPSTGVPFLDWLMTPGDARGSTGQMMAEQFGSELSQPHSAEDVVLYTAIALSAGTGAAGGALRSRSLSTTRVGRWMSKTERVKMERTGRVQESTSGTTHVADPANPDTFGRQAPSGSEYVEFDVPTSSLKPTSTGVSKVLGPNTAEGRNAARKGREVPQMPACTNIKVCGSK